MDRKFHKIEVEILVRLYRGAYIGERHTPLRNAIKGIRKDQLKLAKNWLKN